MSSHPRDHAVADLVRHARLGAAANRNPSRTRTVGADSARQVSVGGLVLEAARADAGVSEEVGQARREVIAAEFERRKMSDAAEETRRRAEADLAKAERERDEAAARCRRQGGPDPDFLTLAMIAAATFEITADDLTHVIDAAVTDGPELSPDDARGLAGERQVGLTPDQLSSELAEAGASPNEVDGLPHTGVDTVPPAELVAQGLASLTGPDLSMTAGVEPEESPEVG